MNANVKTVFGNRTGGEDSHQKVGSLKMLMDYKVLF